MLQAIAIVAVLWAMPAFAQTPSVSITLRDHQFVPAQVSIPAGAKVELKVTNEQKTPAEFESGSLHREQVVTPGSAITVYVGPLSPGNYEFFDDFNPSTRGHLIVK